MPSSNQVTISTEVTTTTETLDSITTSYSTTFVVEEPEVSTTPIYTTTEFFFTTLSATTRTSTFSVPIVTALASLTGSSSFVTPATSSSITSANSTIGASTTIDTLHPTPTGIIVIQKVPSSKTTAILVGILVPFGLICIVAMVWIMRKRRHGRDASTGFTSKHWLEKSDSEPRQPAIPNPPPRPITPPEGERGPFRVASPPRPLRPSSITESALNVMSMSSERGSNVAIQVPIGLAHLRSPRSLDDDDVNTFIPHTDNTPVYDGTRKKYLQAAMEHQMPMDRLTRPSLRVLHPPHTTALRHTSYHPEPLHIHKRTASDANANGYSNGNRYVTSLEETEYPSLVPTEQEFIANVRRGLSKTPPMERAVTEHIDLMADASSAEGSFVQDDEIVQKRAESLAALEGRTPASSSSEWGVGSARGEDRDAFGKQIPPRVRGLIAEETMVARRKANVIDEDTMAEWI